MNFNSPTTSAKLIPAMLAVAIVFSCANQVFATEDASNAAAAPADSALPEPEQWGIHGQLTNITMKHADFNAAYSGANSLSAVGPTEETTDMTLFIGRRLWHDAEIWLNPEIDQGFGFNNTLGMAGYPSGGAYKVGENTPYLRLPRAFFRQVFNLGGGEEKVEAGANQLSNINTENNVTVTIGKFAVPDIFDTNTYAHDPRADFLNWAIVEGGAFDYAADPWGYTYGASVEWKQDWWTLRGALFELSSMPNGKVIDLSFNKNSLVMEGEGRYQWRNHPGKIKFTLFEDHGAMASYQDAINLALQTGSTPDVSLVRKVSTKPGFVANLEQEVTDDLGVFARYSIDGGDKEAYEFSDISKSLSAGLSLKGASWGRADDTVGAAFVVNRISGAAQQYFTMGGLGLLIGDGQLNYAPEQIFETYYSLHPSAHLTATLDFQRAINPAYNQDRGPVSIFGVRIHAEF